jgi:Holliday junction DNA helicase RuvB
MWKTIYANMTDPKPTRPMSFPNTSSVPKVQNTPQPVATSRPVSLADIVGQNDARKCLDDKVQAFKNSGIPATHVLLLGSKGLGKTTLGRAFANDLGSNMVYMYAPAIKTARQLTEIMRKVAYGDELFIDEIHRLHPTLQELLYVALEDFQFSFEAAKGQTETVRLPRFTAVAATTNPSKMNGPLRDRFLDVLYLQDYSIEELATMVQNAASKGSYMLSAEAATRIAQIARRNPRIANNMLQKVMELKRARPNDSDMALVDAQIVSANIDPMLGLDAMSRRYLVILATEKRPLGVRSIASLFGDTDDTEQMIETVIEPFVTSEVAFSYGDTKIAGRLVKFTENGRMITENGMAYLHACVDMQKHGRFASERLI